MASTHKHIRSSTANKRPTTAIADGQIALNTNASSPGLFFKDSTGASIIKIGPVHVGSTAPNATPGAGGSSGNSTGEIWLDNSLTPVGVKIWNGSAWINATPVGSTTVQGLLELATSAETQTGTDTDRAVTPAGLQSKLSDSTSTTSSTTIASSTAVKSAYDLANAALPKSGGTITGNLEIGTTGSLSFEGSTADAFETTIAVTDPTADRTITLPDTTGTVVTTGDTGTVTSTMIANGTIVDADINASAAIAHSKLANITAASVLLGNASNVPTATALTGDVTVTSSGVTSISSGVIVNADVNASAAIAGTKISPDFGSQTITTTGVVSAALGAAATPSITFTGDLNTGIYSPGADQVAISTGGSGRLFVDASGNVGVGLSSPAATFGKAGSVDANGILVTRGAINAHQTNAGIFQYNGNETTIRSYGATAGTGAIVFNTGGGGGSADTERLRITSAGLVGIGTSSPAAALHVSAQDGTIYQQATRGTGTTWRLQTSGANGESYELFDFTNSQRAFIYQGATGAQPGWTFSTAGSPRMYIDNSGRVGIGTATPGSFTPGNLVVEAATTAGITISDSTGGGTASIAFSATSSFQNRAKISCTMSSQSLEFSTATAERMRIDSSGRLLVGTSSSISSAVGFTPAIQVAGASALASISVGRYSNDANGPTLILQKSRNTSAGSQTIIADGDSIGRIDFEGSDGSVYRRGASVDAVIDGSPSAGDLPTRLVFSTTADGASSPTEAFRVTSTQDLLVGATSAAASERLNITKSVANYLVRNLNSNASPFGLLVSYTGAAPNGTGNEFIRCDDTGALRASIRSNGGLANYSANNANLSDRNAKKDISPAADTWDCIKEWEIVNYRYKDQPDDADLNLGVIAQQVAESCPEVITVFQEATEDEPEKLGIKEQQMYWMAIKALQEAQIRIETLEAKVAGLEAQ